MTCRHRSVRMLGVTFVAAVARQRNRVRDLRSEGDDRMTLMTTQGVGRRIGTATSLRCAGRTEGVNRPPEVNFSGRTVMPDRRRCRSAQ